MGPNEEVPTPESIDPSWYPIILRELKNTYPVIYRDMLFRVIQKKVTPEDEFVPKDNRVESGPSTIA